MNKELCGVRSYSIMNFLVFCHPLKTITTELKPGGADIPVTNENKREYIQWVYLFVHFLFPFFVLHYEGELKSS